jgi:3-oxoisoapionate kinase
LDPRELASGERAPIANATERGLDRLKAGRSVILYTALGPSSDIGGEFDQHAGARHAIGRALGQIERALIEQASLSRAIVAGGDTSSHALRELGVYALTTRLPLPETPGSPLCLAHSEDRAIDGLELAFKGGQVGGDDYFSVIRDGGM